MGDRPSVFSAQTICFSIIRVVRIYVLHNKILIFVRFFPFFPASGRKYRILTMHKKQSVKNESEILIYRPWQNKTN